MIPVGASDRQSVFDAIHSLERAEPAEVARGNCGEEIQANIGRRSAVGDLRFGFFLKIVRRKEMIFGGYKFFKETPCSPRNQSQGLYSSGESGLRHV